MSARRKRSQNHAASRPGKQKIRMNLELTVPEGFQVEKVNGDGMSNKFKITYVPEKDKRYSGGGAHVFAYDPKVAVNEGGGPQMGAIKDSAAFRNPMRAEALPYPQSPLTASCQNGSQALGVRPRFRQVRRRSVRLPTVQPFTGTDIGMAQCVQPSNSTPVQSGFRPFDRCPEQYQEPSPANLQQQRTDGGLQQAQPQPDAEPQEQQPVNDVVPDAGDANQGSSFLPFNYSWDRCSDSVRVTGRPKPPPPPPPPCPPAPPPPPPPPSDDTRVRFNSSMNVNRSVPIRKVKNAAIGQTTAQVCQPCPPTQDPNQPPDYIFKKMLNTVGTRGAYDPSALETADWLVPDRGRVELKYSQFKPYGYDPQTGEMARQVQPQCINPNGETVDITTPAVDPFRELAASGPAGPRNRCNRQDGGGATVLEDQTMFGPEAGMEFTGQFDNPCDQTRMTPVCGPNDPPPFQRFIPVVGDEAMGWPPVQGMAGPAAPPRKRFGQSLLDGNQFAEVPCQDIVGFGRTWTDMAFFFYVWLFCVAASQFAKMLVQNYCDAYF